MDKLIRYFESVSSNNESGDLYIPSGVKVEWELFNGFGKREMLQTFVGSLVGFIIALVVWLITLDSTKVMFSIMVSVIASVMFTVKDVTNISVIDQIGYLIRFSKSQKKYKYVNKFEWKK